MRGVKVLRYDGTIQGFKYVVGKTYTFSGQATIKGDGFSFCDSISQIAYHTSCMPYKRFVEVEALGNIIKRPHLYITDKIRIVRNIPWEEVVSQLPKKGYKCHGIIDSQDVYKSSGIVESKGIDSSQGVYLSESVENSAGVVNGHGVKTSSGIVECSYLMNSKGCTNSTNLTDTYGVNSSNACSQSTGISNSNCILDSNGIYNSFAVKNCCGIANGLFVSGMPEQYWLFNKHVTRERFLEIQHKLFSLLGPFLKQTTTNNLSNMKSSSKDYKSIPINDAEMVNIDWNKMPVKAIEYLKTLPEFNEQVFKSITNLS